MRTLHTVALFTATMVGGLGAQEAADFGRLEPGQTVRVRTLGGSRFSTRLGLRDTDSLPLLFAEARVPFAAEAVDSLWVRGRATRTGMIVGAAIAAPLTFAFFAWVCEFVSEGAGCDEYDKVTLLAVGGGAAGALVGGGIGSLIPKWRLRFARDRTIAIAPAIGPGRLGLRVGF